MLQQTACELSLLLTSKQFVLWQDSREEPFKKNAVTTKKGKALEESLLSISHVRLLSISHVHFMCFFIIVESFAFPAVEFQQDGGRRRYPERCPRSQLRVASRAVEGAQEVVKAAKRLGLFDFYVE